MQLTSSVLKLHYNHTLFTLGKNLQFCNHLTSEAQHSRLSVYRDASIRIVSCLKALFFYLMQNNALHVLVVPIGTHLFIDQKKQAKPKISRYFNLEVHGQC